MGRKSFETQKHELEKILEYKHLVLMPPAVHLASEEIMSVVYQQRTLSFATKFGCEV